ncbi:adenosine deaminase [Paenibacillaceae bacterium WGS1546]|uniref:adenosine deaminase n=1 Tax=Cohnella sp. WGS1546 TaxID=3366810 RepID=UPI00372CF5B6
MDLLRLIPELPKVDLHVHLDGCVKPSTLLDLAEWQGVSLPAADEAGLLKFVQVGGDCSSLTEYLERFEIVLPFLQTEEALERVACEAVEQASAHRVRYLEVRFAPRLHAQAGLSADLAIGHVIRGLNRGESRYDVKARAIAICMRNHSPGDNLEVVEAAARYYGKGLVAIDLAGDEAAYPASLFREVFERARERGIPYTIHAGEAAGADSIEEAVLRLGAQRIGHGVRLKENERLLNIVRERKIPLELCPTSNIQTKAVAGWEAYPIREYFERGLTLTVNTDNPGVSGTDITKEYVAIAEKFGFTLDEIVALLRNGIEASFLEPGEKAELREDFERHLAKLGVLEFPSV